MPHRARPPGRALALALALAPLLAAAAAAAGAGGAPQPPRPARPSRPLAPPVWTGGGPGPPEIIGVLGAPLWINCTAPDPRVAALVRRKQSNLLGISRNYSHMLHDYDDEPQKEGDAAKKENQRKFDKNSGSRGRKNSRRDSMQDDITDDYYDSKQNEERDYMSDRGGDDGNGSGRVNSSRRRNEENSNKRKSNKKLQKKLLDRDGGKRENKSPKNSMEYDFNVSVSYVWYHNDTVVDVNDPGKVIYDNGTLFFKRFGGKKNQKGIYQDIGVYRCLANSSHGAMLSTSVSVKYALLDQNFIEYPEDKEVNEGDPFHLPCTIDSVPSYNVTWEKDSIPLASNKRFYTFSTGSLLITNAQKADSGVYRCSITNPILNKTATSPMGSISVVDPVSKPSTIEFVNAKMERNDLIFSSNSTEPQKHKIVGYYGKEMVLGCAVKGWPKPKVTWSYLPDFETEAKEKKEFNSMEILKLPKLSENSSGIYSCKASNAIESISQEYYLMVLQAPYFNLTPMSEQTPPAKTVRFNCSAGGNPPPNVVWYKDGKQLGATGRLKIKKPSGLIISNTISSDKGIYQCVASNVLGEAQAWGALSFRPPKEVVAPPSSVKCMPLNYQTIRITWNSSSNLVAYTIHYVPTVGGEEHSIISNGSDSKIDNLNPYERYEFYIRSYSKTHGASDPSKKVTCQGQGVPVYLYSFSNDSVLLSWRDTFKAIPKIKQWKIQWRDSQFENLVRNVTLDRNFSTYVITGIDNPDKYEFRMLATTTDDWLVENLNELPWVSGKRMLPYNDTLFNSEWKNSLSTLSAFNSLPIGRMDDIQLKQFSEDLGNWTIMNSPVPTDIFAYATGPHTINVTWKCETAESSPIGYIFNVCYTQTSDHNKEDNNPKHHETCTESLNSWIEIPGLQSNTKYEFKVQSVIQNKKKGGLFSNSYACYTKHDTANAVVDVRWEFIEDGVLNISWVPNLKRELEKESDNPNSDLLQQIDGNENYALNNIYTVYYSHNPTAIISDWKSENVTNSTQIQLRNINMTYPFYFMISLLGEGRGSVISIPPGGKLIAINNDSDTGYHQQIVILLIFCASLVGIGIGVGLSIACIAIWAQVVAWHHRKFKRRTQNEQCLQTRSGRTAQNDLECEELVGPTTRVDAKGGVVYMNGLSDAKDRTAGEPLLNGHVHITENPRFSSNILPNGSCRQSSSTRGYGPVFGGTLDLSRYDESPDANAETTLETTLQDDTFNSFEESASEPSCSRPNAYKNGKHLKNGNHKSKCNDYSRKGKQIVSLDRNSNSEITNLKRIKDGPKKDALEGDEEISDKDLFVKSQFYNEKKLSERTILNAKNLNHNSIDYLKDNSSSSLENRGNGNARLLAPALGPNG